MTSRRASPRRPAAGGIGTRATAKACPPCIWPPMFWWMSLLGSTMLLTYFLWRRDVVGILGQGIGLAIYVRNLHLIYFPSEPKPVAINSLNEKPTTPVQLAEGCDQ